MYHWTEYAQTNAQPRPLSNKKDFGICPLKPELEPWEVHTLGLHHPVYMQMREKEKTEWRFGFAVREPPSSEHLRPHATRGCRRRKFRTPRRRSTAAWRNRFACSSPSGSSPLILPSSTIRFLPPDPLPSSVESNLPKRNWSTNICRRRTRCRNYSSLSS